MYKSVLSGRLALMNDERSSEGATRYLRIIEAISLSVRANNPNLMAELIG